MNKIEFLANIDKYKGEDHSTFLQHYGILGQKWGQRRWQNADGTFNDEGKERYFGKNGTTKKNTEDEVGSIYSTGQKIKNLFPQKRVTDSGEEYDERYQRQSGWLTEKGEKYLKNHPDEADKKINMKMYNEYKERKAKEAEEERIAKETKENEIKELLTNARDNIKTNKELKGQDISEKELQDIINDVDGIETWHDWKELEKTDKETFNKIADLGMDAMARSSKYYNSDDNIGDDDWRDWFIYEDQTIGLPQLTKLYYDGYSKDYINKMIDKVNEMDYDDYENKYGEDSHTKFFIEQTNWQNENKKFVDALFDPDYNVKDQKLGSTKSNIPKKVYEANKNDPQALNILENYYKNRAKDKKDSNTKEMDKFYNEKEDNYMFLNKARQNLGLTSKKELTQSDWDKINAEIKRLKK